MFRDLSIKYVTYSRCSSFIIILINKRICFLFLLIELNWMELNSQGKKFTPLSVCREHSSQNWIQLRVDIWIFYQKAILRLHGWENLFLFSFPLDFDLMTNILYIFNMIRFHCKNAQDWILFLDALASLDSVLSLVLRTN